MAHKEQTTIAESSDSLFSALKQASSPVIIYFDEIDYITPGSPVTDYWRLSFNTFWRNLRAVYQEAIRNSVILSIYVCGVSSKWFNVESINGVENAALSFIPEEYLSPLQTGASAAMIKSLSRTAGLVFEQKTAEQIAETCSNIPYWIRKACSFIHRNIPIDRRLYSVTKEEAIALVNAFIDTEGASIADIALSHLFRVYPELEKSAIKVFKDDYVGVLPKTLNTLEKYGIIKNRGGKAHISGDMLQKGLKVYIEKTSEPNETESSTLAYTNTQEWAEDLALINASRNILERKLRAAVLNFIRFDHLSKKTGADFSDRISKVISNDKKNQYKHLSPEELFEKYTWTELTQLVEREWPLFHTLFNDKTKFRQNVEIINKRYDAHAKETSKADIALYRQTIDWFNNCLNKI